MAYLCAEKQFCWMPLWSTVPLVNLHWDLSISHSVYTSAGGSGVPRRSFASLWSVPFGLGTRHPELSESTGLTTTTSDSDRAGKGDAACPDGLVWLGSKSKACISAWSALAADGFELPNAANASLKLATVRRQMLGHEHSSSDDIMTTARTQKANRETMMSSIFYKRKGRNQSALFGWSDRSLEQQTASAEGNGIQTNK